MVVLAVVVTGRSIFGGYKEEGRGGIGCRGVNKRRGGGVPGKDNGPGMREGYKVST